MEAKEFDYLKRKVDEAKQEHKKNCLEKNTPEEVTAGYEGRIIKESFGETETAGRLWENYLFIAANTILPTLFYQVPRPVIRAKPGGSPYSASVLSGLVQAYYNDRAKAEAQACIVDSFLSFGFSTMKVGYNAQIGTTQRSLLEGKTKGTNKEGMEQGREYLKSEYPIIERNDPAKTYIDPTKPWGKGRCISFEYVRTLQELIDSNLYTLSDNFKRYFKARNDDDARKVKLDIVEHWYMKNGFAYKVVWTPEWHEPLTGNAIKTFYEELPVSMLRFNNPPNEKYPISHGKLALEAQRELQYLNDLWKSHIDNIRRQHLIDENALSESGKITFKANVIDGVVGCNRSPASVYQQIVSTPMGQDVYGNIENLRNYLKLLLSVSGGKTGQSDSEFATTEKNKALGDFMRTSGIQDAIRDFSRDQIRKMVKYIVKYGNPELTVKITGKNVIDPFTGQLITGKDLLIGGERGVDLREQIIGDVELDYIYDVDMTSASRPDFAVVRKQLAEAIQLSMQPAIEVKLANKGLQFEVDEMLKDYFNTFDTIADPQKYISEMTPEDKQAYIAKMQMAQAGAGETATSQTQGPTEESIARGVNMA